jgi:hypothetical protein
MASTNRFKWPIPDDTAKVRFGASDMRALAAAQDGMTFGPNEWMATVPAGSVAVGPGSFTQVSCGTPAGASATLSALSADAISPIIATSRPGLYLVHLMVLWAGGTVGTRRGIGFKISTGASSANQQQFMAPPSAAAFHQHVVFLHVNTGTSERIMLVAYQDTAGALNVTDGLIRVTRLASSL